ncbi:hypothetical protein BpHYR1_043647 [Brachionus plicatilis]|uniref:Uncharacterized protein n=1 Tax=Brachionus plicatilis TaxID=10195 RepID=A0A3M7SUL0_BRAPC|nr:hypothetical protein BpHYR1_043647 [Brachionus plicatilis]
MTVLLNKDQLRPPDSRLLKLKIVLFQLKYIFLSLKIIFASFKFKNKNGVKMTPAFKKNH